MSGPGYRDVATCDENHHRFVRRVAEFERVWGLRRDDQSWAFCDSNDNPETAVLLFWSDEGYARRAMRHDFGDHVVDSLTLFDFLYRWLPGMATDRVRAGVNWTADLVGAELDPANLEQELLDAMSPQQVSAYKARLQCAGGKSAE
jgi:hypothetical protein